MQCFDLLTLLLLHYLGWVGGIRDGLNEAKHWVWRTDTEHRIGFSWTDTWTPHHALQLFLGCKWGSGVMVRNSVPSGTCCTICFQRNAMEAQGVFQVASHRTIAVASTSLEVACRPKMGVSTACLIVPMRPREDRLHHIVKDSVVELDITLSEVLRSFMSKT